MGQRSAEEEPRGGNRAGDGPRASRAVPPSPFAAPPSAPTASALPSPAPPPDAPGWRDRHVSGDLSGALAILRREPGGVDAALAGARAAQELMDLSDVLRVRGGDRDAAVRALAQVVDRFPGDANAPLAAYTLGKMLAEQGDRERAAHYLDRARGLELGDPLAPDETEEE